MRSTDVETALPSARARWGPKARGLLLVGAFLVGAFFLDRWVDAIGGPEALVARYGLVAPAVMVVIQAALSAAPFPSELFALVSAATYGWAIGSVMTWAGWTLGSMIQYGLARRGVADMKLGQAMSDRMERLPAWLLRLPIDHPVFLICVRWLPMGAHFANLTAGARKIPVTRQLYVAAIGSIPGAIMWAGIGAGVGFL